MTIEKLELPEDDLHHVYSLLTDDVWRLLEGKRIFLTGGTGFIGKWLLATFIYFNRRLELGAEITVLSRDPYRFFCQYPNLATANEVKLIDGDIRTFVFPVGSFDFVVHAATDVVAKSSPEDIFATCVMGTQRVMDFATTAQVKNFLLVSSGAVYGPQPESIQKLSESYLGCPESMRANSAYGIGKRSAEWIVAAAGERTQMKICSARCFAFVGPYLPLDKQFAIGNFLDAVLDNRSIIIQGDGTPMRSYLYAADMAGWLWAILLKGVPGRAYNVGADTAVSIKALAERICHLLEVTPRIEVKTQRRSELPVERYVPDNSLIRVELNLPPPITLDKSILRTAQWIKAGRVLG